MSDEIRLVVRVNGGIVQSIQTNQKTNIRVLVVDEDDDMYEEDELMIVHYTDVEGSEEVAVTELNIETPDIDVDRLFKDFDAPE